MSITPLATAYQGALTQARQARSEGKPELAFTLLERAHILGQQRFGWHFRVHWRMLELAILLRDGREIRGQLLRLLLTPLGHLTGRLPLGNTGRANVSAFAPMPIAQELQQLAAQAGGVPEAPRNQPSDRCAPAIYRLAASPGRDAEQSLLHGHALRQEQRHARVQVKIGAAAIANKARARRK
ncbi:DUF3703 domain-containing protein [Chitinolyticbacter albus]|uniref:DUF3703 domain-containing protein n=1 Tax=Chitinolyticbacter albus TaxID=2961951 RepID=UPI00210BD5E4|nr:DUF3703 domain-containing protein [Chitinolyticbacter albus]